MEETVPTVKGIPLLATPPTVTTTLPEVAPAGTGTEMLVAPQPVGEAAVPLKTTVLEPWLPPKFVPVMVTTVPAEPEVGLRLVMVGAVPASAARKATICIIQRPEVMVAVAL